MYYFPAGKTSRTHGQKFKMGLKCKKSPPRKGGDFRLFQTACRGRRLRRPAAWMPPSVREVDFAKQKTEGESRWFLSPSQPVRLTAPSSEGAVGNCQHYARLRRSSTAPPRPAREVSRMPIHRPMVSPVWGMSDASAMVKLPEASPSAKWMVMR